MMKPGGWKQVPLGINQSYALAMYANAFEGSRVNHCFEPHERTALVRVIAPSETCPQQCTKAWQIFKTTLSRP